ncbi:MAG: tRNA guanosine(34) transglycosylase Tgt [Dongiaceae bacterium]
MSAAIDYPNFSFTITAQDKITKARAGKLVTPHGVIETPGIVFCATNAALKSILPSRADELGTQAMFVNTYEAWLHEVPEITAQAGGLHKFMRWQKPLLTDSGGFQIFSMKHGGVLDEVKSRGTAKRDKTLISIDEAGATFRSYRNGDIHTLTAEISIQLQRQLGADLVMMFDECTAFRDSEKYTADSMARSCRWGMRSLEEFKRHHDGTQVLYGISQGGVYPKLRAESAAWMNEQPFFGQAVGGCFGQDQAQFHDTIAFAREPMRDDRPTHALGVGYVQDVWEMVALGIDTMDCVHPTRVARTGRALSWEGPAFFLNLKNAAYRFDHKPLDENSKCPESHYSRSYIHHLFRSDEHTAGQILAAHNMAFMNQLMADIRSHIIAGSFSSALQDWRGRAKAA